MSQELNGAIAVIGIDIGKSSFHIVRHDYRGAIVLRQKWSRGEVETRLANLPPCLIGMEACVGAQQQIPKASMSQSPKCGHQIPLTESIAAPLLEAERHSFQTKLAAKEAEFARKADELRQRQNEVAKARANVEEQIKQRLETERRQVALAEAVRDASDRNDGTFSRSDFRWDGTHGAGSAIGKR